MLVLSALIIYIVTVVVSVKSFTIEGKLTYLELLLSIFFGPIICSSLVISGLWIWFEGMIQRVMNFLDKDIWKK